jgi:hypothetical protein
MAEEEEDVKETETTRRTIKNQKKIKRITDTYL